MDNLTRMSKLQPGWKAEVPVGPRGMAHVEITESHIKFTVQQHHCLGPSYKVEGMFALIRVPCHFGGHRRMVRCAAPTNQRNLQETRENAVHRPAGHTLSAMRRPAL